MRLSCIRIQNFKSIVDSGEVRLESIQALVGENNAGKSNVLRAIDAFLSGGAGGVQSQHFFDQTKEVVIEGTFTDLRDSEKKALRKYLMGGKLILQKRISLVSDAKTEKPKVESEYHGYMAEPKDWWLSLPKIQEKCDGRPKWEQIAKDNGILEYVTGADGKVNKNSYEAGIQRIIAERGDLEFDEAVAGKTKALGRQSALLSHLPRFYLLPAITDYSSEIDKRSTTTVFRRLMTELAERMLTADPRFSQVEDALRSLEKLFNEGKPDGQTNGAANSRLKTLENIENTLRTCVCQLMPDVTQVKLQVVVETSSEMFSRGVALRIDDGVLTDVLDKGHGLQRCVVFSLLQTLISNRPAAAAGQSTSYAHPIILAIEEPELYIHPQLQRRIYSVLRKFVGEPSKTDDQVVYSTHSPAFVDVANYNRIAVLCKPSTALGTKAHQCEQDDLTQADDRKTFQLLSSFGLAHNQMFFAKHRILVEGDQDEIALIAAGRKLSLFEEFPEECDYSIVVCNGKEGIAKFQKLLNAFKLPYAVLVELDGNPETEDKNKSVLDLLNGNVHSKIQKRLEDVVNHTGHFHHKFLTQKWFSDEAHISSELIRVTRELFTLPRIDTGA